MSDLTEIEKLNETIKDLRGKAAAQGRNAVLGVTGVLVWFFIVTFTFILPSADVGEFTPVLGVWIGSFGGGFGSTVAAFSISNYIKNKLAHDEAVAERAALIR